MDKVKNRNSFILRDFARIMDRVFVQLDEIEHFTNQNSFEMLKKVVEKLSHKLENHLIGSLKNYLTDCGLHD